MTEGLQIRTWQNMFPACVGWAPPWRSPVEEHFLLPSLPHALFLLPPSPSFPVPAGLFLQGASRGGSWQSPKSLQEEFSTQASLKVRETSPEGQEGSGGRPPLTTAAQGDAQPFELLLLFRKDVRESRRDWE